ncbi:porin family protein [Pontibacter harenae]|uniref:porin family protein n=1 Tax=Pontibacter harenae TaxID=2894083 RepID=UPI001E4878B8|nr:porin family protein [Pontibacter harenae]MCC9168363.1 PorT family protein [Pontibacter harenae]
MKTEIFVITLLFTVAFSAQAQYSRFGAKIGGALTSAVGSDAPSSNINYKAGMHGGLVYTYEFISRIAFQTEMLYSRKGFTYDNYSVSESEAYAGDLILDYVEVPLLFKLQKAALFVEAGPYVGYLFNEESNVNLISTTDPTPGGTEPLVLGEQYFSKSQFNTFDYGYTVGIGLALQNGLFMSLRNTGGLRSFRSDDLSQRNMVWQFSIGYLLPAIL